MTHQEYIEKCSACNGRGTIQKFDHNINKWIHSDIKCKECLGAGKLRAVVYKFDNKWCFQKDNFPLKGY